jgi:hypothetical protein
MLIKQLIVNNEGTISHSKLWSNIAYLAGTIKFIMIPAPEANIWMAYLGIVGGAAVASKLIQMKYGDSSK